MPKDRRGDSATESADPPIRLVKHIEQLGLCSAAEYLDWCQRSGFEGTLDKTRAQLEHERHVVRARAGQVAQLGRLARNPRRLIEQVCAGQVAAHDIARPQWRAMCERIEASSTSAEARRSLGQLLLKVHDATDLLTESVVVGGASRPTIDGLIGLNERRAQWIRPLEAWAPRSHNSRRQFSSLVRHLLARYPVPLFMDEAWFRRDEAASNLQDWFVLVGSGRNIRIANTPIPLTKK